MSLFTLFSSILAFILALFGGGGGSDVETTSPVEPSPTVAPTMSPVTTPVAPSSTESPIMSPSSDAPVTTASETRWMPKASDRLTWQWQLQGSPIDTSFNVDVYDIDLFDVSAAEIASIQASGSKVICYFSAGSYEGWRPDWQIYFPFITGDEYSGDEGPFGGRLDGWDERWLDIREVDELAPIMISRLQMAVSKGCDGVEPDNVDAYTNGAETQLSLSYEDQINYNRFLANEAHKLNVSIGLKNDVDQLADLVDDFDWALNEQCFQYSECGTYTPTFIQQDKAVFGVEYEGNPSVFCAQANNMNLSWLYKELDLFALPRIGCEDF